MGFLGNDDPTMIPHDTWCWLQPNWAWAWAAYFQCTPPVPCTRKCSGHQSTSLPNNINIEQNRGKGQSSKAKHARQFPFLQIQRETIPAFDAAKQRLLSDQCMKCFDPTINLWHNVATRCRTPFGSWEHTFILNNNVFPVLSLPTITPPFQSSKFFHLGLSYHFISHRSKSLINLIFSFLL